MRLTTVAAILIAATLALSAAPAPPQQPSSASPEFDVASIKRNTSGASGPGARTVGRQPGGRFTMIDGSVLVLIRSAYAEATDIIGAPDWTLAEHYDVLASAGTNDLSNEQFRAMVRSLLVTRFQFAAHIETRDRPSYALVVARADRRVNPQLQRFEADCVGFIAAAVQARERPQLPTPANGAPPCGYALGGRRLMSGGMTLEALGGVIERSAGRPIIDRTGLDGVFEFTLDWTGDLSIFTALEEQLGLKLEATQAALPVVVIDRIERPTPD